MNKHTIRIDQISTICLLGILLIGAINLSKVFIKNDVPLSKAPAARLIVGNEFEYKFCGELIFAFPTDKKRTEFIPDIILFASVMTGKICIAKEKRRSFRKKVTQSTA
ncbi:MAG: hypothetical protein ACC608_04185 [Anaerofustis sp.]|jgi:uncharacterized membrane protein